MKKVFITSLITTLVFASAYWLTSNASLCRYPVTYSIGTFDERFSLTTTEARLAISDAAAAWEEAVGLQLFTYRENAPFTINFVFDDRQALSDEERQARDELAALEAENIALTTRFSELTTQHSDLQAAYQRAVADHEAALFAYNQRVATINQGGGATPAQQQELEVERASLEVVSARLNEQVDTINQLAAQINQLGEQGNRMIDTYNQAVAAYNNRFGGSREFTQGEYQGDRINIYTFATPLELRQVLAHELGHAIGLEHVEDPQAIMFYLMGTQPDELVITDADIAEFERVCSDGPGWRGLLSHYSTRFLR